ncbi:MAG TPA: DUF1501 domain-containing protein [Polyangia bacterium]|nr:DUF1501 domain-containing protein [Polyangia bacterium]
MIIVHAPGAPRWSASFDAQSDLKHNPWGVMPWSTVGRGQAPQWGFSRMILQRPLAQTTTSWATNIYPYLQSDDPAHYNVVQPALKSPGWKGALLPTYADIANDVAVVRLTGNPGGQFDGDHASASHTLYTGYRSGQIGLATVMHKALRDQLGAQFDAQYPLPAVSVGQPAWSFGVGDYAGARPIFLTSPSGLPTTDPGKSVSAWGRKAEGELDAAFQASRQAFMAQSASDFINDKMAGDAHVTQLINPALHLATPGAAALGTLIDGTTPVTNDMLNEVFGLDNTITPAGDLLFDCFGALASSTTPTWNSTTTNNFGFSGALAVRLLQIGAPLVSVTMGSWDTHSYEVIDPQNKHPQTVQVAMLGRMLAALDFALKNIADPLSPGVSLWDSTVVFVCSEFGRGGNNIGTNGFNSPDGQNDGGSDHDPFAGWPIFGGPVEAGGRLLTDSGNGGFYHQNRVYTTVLKGLGIDDVNNAYLPYGTFAPISGLIRGV